MSKEWAEVDPMKGQQMETMSEFNICDKGIEALWGAVSRELHELVAPRASLDAVTQFLFHEVCRVVLVGGHDIYETVPDAAHGAADGAERLRFRPSFYAHLTLAAKDAYSVRSH